MECNLLTNSATPEELIRQRCMESDIILFTLFQTEAPDSERFRLFREIGRSRRVIALSDPYLEFHNFIALDNFEAGVLAAKTLHRAGCHVEVTTLVIPGRNDSDEAIDAIAARIASVSPEIPLHVTRFFPRFQMTDAEPTPVATIRRLVSRASGVLPHVLPGNC